MINAYDEIAYPPLVHCATQPDRIGAFARVFGLEPAPPGRCRVLEIGSGDGSNLIPMALRSAGSDFVGFDLARSPIERGVEMARALGLENIRLLQADILDVDLGPDRFDYIIAHGIYSWVPEAARNGLMSLVRRYLAPHGVAYVSYNALPGGYIRQAIRQELLFGARNIVGRTAQVAHARRRLETWPEPSADLGSFQRAVAEEAGHMRQRTFGALAHDELSDAYHPVFLSDFNAHCTEHSLQIMCDADALELSEWLEPSDSTQGSVFDPVAVGQQDDFAGVRYFRQSLIVGAEAALTRRPIAERFAQLHISSKARRIEGGRFECEGLNFELHDAPLIGVLEHLATIWPNTAPAASLLRSDDRLLALPRLCGLKAVELFATSSCFITGDRPTASPLVRLQAKQGQTQLTSLRHIMVDVEDEFGRGFLARLDGSRTRAEIAREVASHLDLTPEGALVSLEAMLEAIARAALLVN